MRRTRVPLCRDIKINTVHHGLVAMTMLHITDQIVQIMLQFQLEIARDPFIEKIRCTDLWTGSDPGVEQLLRNLCFHCNKRKTANRFGIIGHIFREGRKETADLWDIYSIYLLDPSWMRDQFLAI